MAVAGLDRECLYGGLRAPAARRKAGAAGDRASGAAATCGSGGGAAQEGPPRLIRETFDATAHRRERNDPLRGRHDPRRRVLPGRDGADAARGGRSLLRPRCERQARTAVVRAWLLDPDRGAAWRDDP